MRPNKWWHYIFLTILVGSLVLTALGVLAISIVYPSLPSLEALTNYRPKLPLKIYSAEGILLGEFGEERRAFVNIDNVPKHMKDAILAIEDRRFYQHNGIDTMGVMRAIRNNITGKSHEGASTITMQVAKNFFSRPNAKRDILIKIKEAMLAIKIEKTIEKDQILELYFNQIYLGQRAYGFAAASQVYFGKPLKEINLAEAALLAGLPKAPTRYNPYFHKERSISRQHEVLRDMKRYGFIDEAKFNQALETTLTFKSAKTTKNLSADYISELIRVSMYKRYGEEIYQNGFKVYTTIKKPNQEAANKAVVEGIIDYEMRQGYRGPERKVPFSSSDDADTLATTYLSDAEVYNGFIPAIVLKADKQSISVIAKNSLRVEITGSGLNLIKHHILNKKEPKLGVFPGDVIRITKLNNQWQVVQLPEVEASFIAINPETGAVNALVGGFDFNRNKFNHVTQAWRQPGSSFKPFVYSAALEKGFTPSSIVDDSPITFSAEEVGGKEDWSPRNFEEKYSGPTRLRSALTKSKNMVSIRVIKSIGPRYAQSYVSKFGFSPKHHPAYYAMALGAGSTTSWHLAAGYAVFANSGYSVAPYLISKVVNADGEVVESVNPADHVSSTRVIDPRNAFLMTTMMQDVIKVGTAKKANVLGRTDIAGKTGTTNNQMDVWFAGYNPKEVAVAWLGYDSPKSLGKDETGGKSALPIWIKYMDFALKNTPVFEYKVPQGVIKVKVSPSNGRRVEDYDYGIYEYFYHENPPREQPVAEIPSLEESTEPYYTDSPGDIGNDNSPLQPQPPSHAPVEERKLESARSTETRGSSSTNSAAELLSPSN